MALVHVIDIATGQVVAAYPVPPTTQIEIGPDQLVQFVDIPHGDPASPNVTIEVINDTDVAVATVDGTVVIQGLYAFLEAGQDVRLLFADTGRAYGDGGAVPQFASLDDFIATAAGGPGGTQEGTDQTGTGGRGNDGGIAPPDLNLFHIPAAGVDGLIPRPEFDDPIDIETDFINVEEPIEPVLLTPSMNMVWESALNGGGGEGDGEGGGGDGQVNIGGGIFITGHDSDEHNNGAYMTAGLDYLFFGEAASDPGDRSGFTIAFLDRQIDSGAIAALEAFGWTVIFYDVDSGSLDIDALFASDAIMVGSGDNVQSYHDALIALTDNFTDYINGGGKLYINTDEGFGQTWYDFVPDFGTASNNTISASGAFTVTADGSLIGLTEPIVDADITHSFYTGVDTNIFTIFEVTDPAFFPDNPNEPVAFGALDITIDDGGFSSGGSGDPGSDPTSDGEFAYGVVDTGGGTITDFSHPDGTTSMSGDFFIVDGPYWTIEVNKFTGEYTFELLDNTLEHDGVNLVGELDQIFLEFGYTVDVGGQTASSTLTIGVKDDGPSIDGEGAAVSHDETPGLQVDADDTSDPLPADLDARLTALLVGPEIGHASSGADEVTWVTGADGFGNLALTTASGDAFNGQDSGLDRTSDGADILLYTDATDDNLVLGMVGADIVFAIYIDETDGSLWLVQYEAIEHPIAGDDSLGEFDDSVSLTNLVYVTITDGELENGDSATTTFALDISFQDDGPNGGFQLEVGTATVDEDGLVADGDTNAFADPDGDGDNNILTATGFIGVFGGDFGTDGPADNGGVFFAAQTAPAGLTSLGDPVVYTVSADGLTLTASAGGRTVFTVTLDLASNEYDLVLSDVIDHDSNSDSGVLSFDLMFIDGDGDFVLSEDALSINIVDAQPVANDDMDMAVENGTPTTGNVITGIDNDAAPNDGSLLADVGGADGLTVIRSVTHNGITYALAVDGLSVIASDASTDHSFDGTTLTFDTAEGGSLSIDLTGGTIGAYSYTPPASVDNSEGNPEEAFVYVIEDGDGDSDDATLTIEVKPGNAPTGGLEQITVDDEGLDGGIPGGDGDVAGEDDVITGTLDFNYGGDGAGSIDFASMHNTMAMVGGEMVTYSWDGGTNTLTATSARGDVFQVVLTDPVAGTYEFTLLLPAIHTVANTEDDIVVNLTYTVRDSDGTTASGTLEVTIDDDEPAVGTTENLVLSNSLNNAGTADLDLDLGADGPGGYSLTMAMGADGNQTALVEGAGVYGIEDDGGGPIVEQMTSSDIALVWHDNGDGTWSAVLDGTSGTQQDFEDATVFTVSVNPDGTYTVTLDDNLALDGGAEFFELDFTGGIRGGNSQQLVFFDSENPDDNSDGIPDGSTIMGYALAKDADGSIGTVNSSVQGMGVSQGNTIDVADVNGTDTSEELRLFFGEPIDPALLDENPDGMTPDPDFIPRAVTFAVITLDSLSNGEFAIIGVVVGGSTYYFKVAGSGMGANEASDELFTVTQGALTENDNGGTGTINDPYVVDMTGGSGTGYVDGTFSELVFLADTDTDSSYRLVSAEGIEETAGVDSQTTFTAEGTDSDGDTASTTFDVTFDSGEELTGSATNDVLVGDADAQTLDGGQGDDIMTGGEGPDIFQWAEADIDLGLDGTVDFVDTVTDFSGAGDGDTLDISQLLNDLGATAGTASSFFQTVVNGDGNVEIQVDTTGSGGSWQTFAIVQSGDGLLNAALETDVDNGIVSGF